MEYTPLERYGLIGNLQTSALVSDGGGIDWYCAPHVESPSIFARLLDTDRGGHFTIHPCGPYRSTHDYIGPTNVLQTRFLTETGSVTLTDFMPVMEQSYPTPIPADTIFRRLSAERGRCILEVVFEPAFDYAQSIPGLSVTSSGVEARANGIEATVCGFSPSDIDENSAVGTIHLKDGATVWLPLTLGDESVLRASDFETVLSRTKQYWRDWTHECPRDRECYLRGPWHDLAVRSGLVLKLLTHHGPGAICAAPTTSLPERVGGERNWDYRYNWLRDAAFTTQALFKLGHRAEALDYLEWLQDRCRLAAPDRLQPLYGLHGETDLKERELDHLDGYRGSRPVRVGNEASNQFQLDIYGELVDAVYETTRHGHDLSAENWEAVRAVIDYVCDVWTQPDAGIWEVRSGPEQFVYSKLMCWVALDRGLKLVNRTAFDGPTERWERNRDEIRQRVLTAGFNEELGSFVRSFESDTALDATGLLIPLRGFLPIEDPRVQGTIDRTLERLTTGEGFVYRYEGSDGLRGGEGAFLLCSFWLVDVLALSGRVQQAIEIFERMISLASPLGLFAEEIDPDSGTQLGNYPQAFSHIGFVNSALYLTRALGLRHPGPELRGVGS